MIDDKLRYWLELLMKEMFGFHRDLNYLALRFQLPKGGDTISARCTFYAQNISEEQFKEFAERVLNFGEDYEWEEAKHAFARALRMYGFNAEQNIFSGWVVSFETRPEALQIAELESKTWLSQMGFEVVQNSLELAETAYIEGKFSQSLLMSRKAFDDLVKSLSGDKQLPRKKRNEFISTIITSKSGMEIADKIYSYACKGKELEIPEYEAIFGYHLVVSVIHFVLLSSQKPTRKDAQSESQLT